MRAKWSEASRQISTLQHKTRQCPLNRDFTHAVAPHGTTARQEFTLGKFGRMRKNYAMHASS
ncbi:hypothetical protein [Rhizobium changzhiense]|uniref:Uncharacterized protein n=1 Tax=Rhizobium changzhiense TaxID=2692317 RepID=A0ABR6AE34_9HYPH|nr:hypothetical protein [Rhizobium changzhiense]MBA5804910.1 hypothetical protein [Rhizobium changzhiense]